MWLAHELRGGRRTASDPLAPTSLLRPPNAWRVSKPARPAFRPAMIAPWSDLNHAAIASRSRVKAPNERTGSSAFRPPTKCRSLPTPRAVRSPPRRVLPLHPPAFRLRREGSGHLEQAPSVTGADKMVRASRVPLQQTVRGPLTRPTASCPRTSQDASPRYWRNGGTSRASPERRMTVPASERRWTSNPSRPKTRTSSAFAQTTPGILRLAKATS